MMININCNIKMMSFETDYGIKKIIIIVIYNVI